MARQQTYRYTTPKTYRRPYAGWTVVIDRRFWLVSAGLALLGGLFLTALAGGWYAYYNLTGRISPGVQVSGVSLGGLTVETAQVRLEEAWQSNDVKVVITDGARTWSSPVAELGFGLDGRASVERAYQAARGPSGWINPLELLRRDNRAVEPVILFDPQVGREPLVRAATQIDAPAVEAQVRFENGHFVALPGREGSVVDVDATLQSWQSNAQAYLHAGLLPLTMKTVYPQVRDASAQAAQLEALAQTPLKIEAYDAVSDETLTWEVPAEQAASWVRVVGGEGGSPALSLDSDAFAAYLQDLQQSLGGRYFGEMDSLDDLTALWQQGKPFTALLRHGPTQYTVEAGDNLVSIAFKTGIPYWMIQRANTGMNPNALNAGEVLTIPSLDDNLPLPVVRSKRIVISISQQRLWTYENGQQRSENIISTGIDRSPTMPGVFQVRSHDPNAYASIWDLWMPNFMGIYEAAPGFMNGLHGLPTLSSGQRLWANVLGSKASYGCIILTLEEAEDLYHWAEEGVVVEIRS